MAGIDGSLNGPVPSTTDCASTSPVDVVIRQARAASSQLKLETSQPNLT